MRRNMMLVAALMMPMASITAMNPDEPNDL
jgi:hypothetical protein